MKITPVLLLILDGFGYRERLIPTPFWLHANQLGRAVARLPSHADQRF